MEPTINSVAIDLAAVKTEMIAVRSDIRDIKDGINGLMQIRERIGEFTVQHDGLRKELNTVWSRIDAANDVTREHQKTDDEKHATMIAQINRWRGAIQALTIVAAALTTLFGGITFKLYQDIGNAIVDIKVIQNKVK